MPSVLGNADDQTAARPRSLQAASILLGGLALTTLGLAAVVMSAAFGDTYRPLVVGLFTWCVAAAGGVFHLRITRDDLYLSGPIARSTAVGSGLAWIGELLLFDTRVPVGTVSMIAVSTLVSMMVGLQLGRRVLLVLWRRGEFRTSAVVVGNGNISRELELELTHRPDLGIDVVDHVVLTGFEGDTGALWTSLTEHRPDRLIVGDADVDDTYLLPILRRAGALGTRVYVLPRLFEMGVGNPLFTPDRLRGYPLLRVNRSTHPQLSAACKRTFDIVAASLALLIVSPILTVAALAVRMTSPGPTLFWQERIGQYGKSFFVPKLRSMTGGETGDTDWTAEARITAVGRILRRTAIDELPQLWTVVRGDMSLVGPRPERPAFVEQFASEHPRYADRLRMRAGLTGLSQIAGLRGDTSIAERAKYDNLYIDQWSFAGDLVILLRTAIAIVREGTYAQAHRELEAVITLDTFETADLDMRLATESRVDLRPTNSHHRVTQEQ